MTQENANKPKRGLKRPVEVVRAELLKDPETKKIAEAVSMKLEDYVELVLKYAQDKDKEPELAVVSDEELKKNGFTPMSTDEVATLIVKGMKGELPGSPPDFEASKFTQGKSAAGKPSLSPQQEQASAPQDPAAQQALLDQLKRGGSGGNRA
ncbi:hypothetical protein JY651_41585 [Pyxidicoccus parkwayensis]|uniref:Uncharacterized protein n=1 Tax=Pyxidicoccus parkwayensis TaxID=2813578 RepID=A0ABX7NRT6_9BACT|nr:hypothetical protein [Pyxidicoccus parkwaysis]QSQ21600.1 hypothetical protein JY651_41585 [Pyxidicoccus parkwaysis]